MHQRVLVVDDEAEILEVIGQVLIQHGFDVTSATLGREALRLAGEIEPEAIILDVRLPDMDGIDVCRAIRKGSTVPILMMTGVAKEEFDRVLGLEIGADDYLCKPFHLRELVARTKALIRRNQEWTAPPAARHEPELQLGNLRLSPLRHEVWRGSEQVRLTPKEFELLEYLMKQRGIALTRGELLKRIWGLELNISTRTLDVHIRRLRSKLEEDPDNPLLIETIPGIGYKLAEQQVLAEVE
jgi:DNA-binding response OmpR family regulator